MCHTSLQQLTSSNSASVTKMSSDLKEPVSSVKNYKQTKLPFTIKKEFKHEQRVVSENKMEILFHSQPPTTAKNGNLPLKKGKKQQTTNFMKKTATMSQKQEQKYKKNAALYKEKKAQTRMAQSLKKYLFEHSKTGWANENITGSGIGGGGWKTVQDDSIPDLAPV